MGTAILIATLAIEVALAAHCVVTRSSQPRLGSFVRIGELAAFVALTLASVVEWSFRWYGLAALLVVWAALGARTLARGKPEKYGAGRVAFRTFAALALVIITLTPALVFPQHRAPKVTGAHQVATVSYTYTDESRVETFANTGERRRVNVEFWYPKGAGKYPLVVFSHGAFGIKTSNTSTFEELASNGYVVCSIDHPYHSLFTRGSDGKLVIVDRSFLQEVMDANQGVYDDAAELQIYQKWMKVRTDDISFVLDTVLSRAKGAGADEVYQRVDAASKIGLIGHSLGGAASAQVGRERSDVGAVVNLDADLLGEYLGVADGKPVLNDKVYPVPLLSIYSDDMVQLFAAVPDPTNAIPGKRIAATSPNAYEMHIAGTNHMSLTDLPLVSPVLVTLIGDPKGLNNPEKADPCTVVETMNAKALQFFDAFLKGKGSFSTSGA